jgi:hypothetical protein
MTSANSNSLKLQEPNSFATKKFEFAALSRSMGSKETGGRFTPTAIRMRAVRRASVYPDRQNFADFLGITASRLSNIENGFPLSRDVQNRVIDKMSWISRSWLVDGDEASLTGSALHRLAPLVAEESDTTTPRSRSRPSKGRASPP